MKETPMLMCGAMVRATLADLKTETRRIVKPDSSWTRFYGGDKNAAFEAFNRDAEGSIWNAGHINGDGSHGRSHWQCGDDLVHPNYQEGDRLWVRETWTPGETSADRVAIIYKASNDIRPNGISCEDFGSARWFHRPSAEIDDFKKDINWMEVYGERWRPSIFMPRWASRITLEVTSVRVERIQSISEDDAKAEGIEGRFHPNDPECWTWKDYSRSAQFKKDIFQYGSLVTPISTFQGLWDSLNAKRNNGIYAWAKNPWVWVITFKKL